MATKQKIETANERIVRRHSEVLEEIKELFDRKNRDYNGGVNLESYFPFGLKSYAQMIHVKSQRVVSLASSGVAPTNESVMDSLKDVINYAVFAIIALEDFNERV